VKTVKAKARLKLSHDPLDPAPIFDDADEDSSDDECHHGVSFCDECEDCESEIAEEAENA
jgi:hypothetical protein